MDETAPAAPAPADAAPSLPALEAVEAAVCTSPLFRLLSLSLLLLVVLYDVRHARLGGTTPLAQLHALLRLPPPQPPPPAAAATDPALALPGANAACLASQLALGRQGRLLEASLSPRSATPRALALAIPIYPPHFPYLLNFIAPLVDAAAAEEPPLGWDVFPVFTNEEDAAAFEAYLADRGLQEAYAPHYTPLVLAWDDKVAARLAATAGWGLGFPFTLYKNYHAMALLHPCYAHLAALDAEMTILRPRELVRAFAERARAGVVLAGYVPRYRYFNLWSTCMFEPGDRARLAALTRDHCLYSWWSDLPVVIASDVPQFLAYIGYPIHFASPHNYEFGHVVYERWKLMREEWQAADLSAPPVNFELCGSLEMMGRAEDYEAVRAAHPPGPRWLNAAFCKRHAHLCGADNEALVMLFHLNRDQELLDLAARQTCEAQAFNKDPEEFPENARQGCVWYNGSRSDELPPIVGGQ
jgi:hypothetical protein